jgi:hypothetical protein
MSLVGAVDCCYRQRIPPTLCAPTNLRHRMTRPRAKLVRPTVTKYYHCITRCVRRAWLCGQDPLSGRNYDHRRQWIIDRLTELTGTFAIDVCSFAVMSNHYHVVVHLDPDRCAAWTDQEVAERWLKLYHGTPNVQQWLDGNVLMAADLADVQRMVQEWRRRLCDLSWFMRNINEFIARAANREDECTGRFWEGRFKSQALLDRPALLTGMVYVDLNAIRAGAAATPETSAFTSVAERIARFDQVRRGTKVRTRPWLARFSDERGTKASMHVIPFKLRDYLRLVDWCGRRVRGDKRGAIRRDIPPILERLGVNQAPFLDHLAGKRGFQAVVGRAAMIRNSAAAFGAAYLKGTATARLLFN